MRIVGQCLSCDLASIEHLVDILDDASKFDVSTLTNNQKWATVFLSTSIHKGIRLALVRRVVKEVLFWGETGKAVRVTIKFKQVESLRDDTDKFKKLWKGGTD